VWNNVSNILIFIAKRVERPARPVKSWPKAAWIRSKYSMSIASAVKVSHIEKQ